MTYMRNHILYLLSFIIISVNSQETCPKPCTCKWISGKQSVLCNEKGLFTIPDNMSPETSVLDFSGNHLQTLKSEEFAKRGLVNLHKLHLARCRITSIHNRTFLMFEILVDLDLSENSLKNVPSESFSHFPRLRRLSLSSNPLKIIHKTAFSYLSELRSLDLSRCQISYIQERSFETLSNLNSLMLNGNQLKFLEGLIYFPNKTLRDIQLQDNPWNCDCHIVELHEFVRENNDLFRLNSPICETPLIHSKQNLQTIPITKLACYPKIVPTLSTLEVGVGQNISLLCHAIATPEPRISWIFGGKLIQSDSLNSPSKRLKYIDEVGTQNKQSELFIYNTNGDDNGTFICRAENAAGTKEMNFVVKVNELTKE